MATSSPAVLPAPMLDVAIVGAGLCGLRLATLLQPSSGGIGVFEARERFGGRVLTVADGAIDLGPTWYWPSTQPRITRLIAELGLPTFAQHDDGRVLQLRDPAHDPETVAIPGLHGGARRISGGIARLTQALAQRLPPGSVHPRHRLLAAAWRGDHVELELQHGDAVLSVRAGQLVLALPPRLIDETIRFTPQLPAPLRAALRETPTWMATAAKAAMRYGTAFWRTDGHSGNAFVRHPQALLCEVFDACDEVTGSAALAGFVELDPAQRQMLGAHLPRLLRGQYARLFGPAAADGELYGYDWAADPLTCGALDRHEPATTHPRYGDARLDAPQWDGRLLIGGSETAASGGGYLEGALEAAARLAAQLRAPPARTDDGNERLARFRAWVQAERDGAFAHYRRALQRRLAGQQRRAVTQQALLDTVEALYGRALTEIAALRFDTDALTVEGGRSALTPQLLAPFVGFNDGLLDAAMAFNRSSCALSNFPFEHTPDRDYLDVIRRDLAAAWRAFALAIDARLLPATPPLAPQDA